MNINDKDFIRYSRQIMLPDVGEEGQLNLMRYRAVVIGIGGLGTLVAHYLAAAGVGEIELVDGDSVESGNLPRQLIFSEQDIGKNKATVAFMKLQQQYPDVHVSVRGEMFTENLKLKTSSDTLVFDCCDNFSSRHLINRFCVSESIPSVSAAAANFSGQLFAYQPSSSGCYHCLYPETTQVSESCQSVGILGPMVGTIAAMQALAGLKIMLGDENAFGKLWLFDGRNFQWQTAILKPDPNCPVCGHSGPRLLKEKVA